jgi:AcrR family transcriptional regulator
MLTPLGKAAAKFALRKPQRKRPQVRQSNPTENTPPDKSLSNKSLADKNLPDKKPLVKQVGVRPRLAEAKTGKEGEDKRDNILDAAEEIFAGSGFDGAGMRQISARAGVAQALIHYHFKTKERLFEEVVARRSQEINRLRSHRLRDLLAASKKPSLKKVVEALVAPTIEVGQRLAQSTSDFSKILVSINNSADRRSAKLMQAYFDPVALEFIGAFEKSAPKLSHQNAVWAYMFSTGVGVTMMAQTAQAQRLSNGICDDTDMEAMLAHVVPFVTAGIRAVAGITHESPQNPNPKSKPKAKPKLSAKSKLKGKPKPKPSAGPARG